MYPVPFMGLQGWVLRDFARWRHVRCAEKSAVTWGGRAYAELGYGPKGRNRAPIDLVPSLEGKTTRRVACATGKPCPRRQGGGEGLTLVHPGPGSRTDDRAAKDKGGAQKGGGEEGKKVNNA